MGCFIDDYIYNVLSTSDVSIFQPAHLPPLRSAILSSRA